MEESSPARVSTITLWPASTSVFTPEGTMPTRDSWSFTSLGTPMSIGMRFSTGNDCAGPVGRSDIYSRAAAVFLLRRVYLRALQLIGIVHVDGLPLAVEI